MLGGKLIHCQKVLEWYTFTLSFTFIGIKTLIIYCFHVFFDETRSYFDDYEIEVIQKLLVKRTPINPERSSHLMAGYRLTTNRRGRKSRIANSRY
jgi:hypothetical protein